MPPNPGLFLGDMPVRQVASIGSAGELPNHMHRDMMRNSMQKQTTPRPILQNVWFLITSCFCNKFQVPDFSLPFLPLPGSSSQQHCLLCPRLLLSASAQELPLEGRPSSGCRAQWFGLMNYLLHFGITIQKPSRSLFWVAVAIASANFGRLCHRRGECTPDPIGKRGVFPLSLHGDGVAVASARGKGVKTVDCLNWGSLLASGPTKLTSYLIWFCFNHTAKKSGFQATWPGFWTQLCWNLKALWQGKWPATTSSGDPHPLAGQPLAGGFFCSRLHQEGRLAMDFFTIRGCPQQLTEALCTLPMHKLWGWAGHHALDGL